MWDVIAVAALVALAALSVVGAPVFLIVRRRLKASRTVSALLAAVATPILVGMALWITNECMLSRFMKLRLPAMLTEAELSTLRGEDFFCPTTFSFVRRGKRASAIVMTGLFRDKIFIADDNGP